MLRRFLLAVLSLVLLAVWLPAVALARADGEGTQRADPQLARSADADRNAQTVDEATRARRIAQFFRERKTERRFRTLSFVRSGIALAGFGVFGWGVWLRRRGHADRAHSARVALLSLLAVASFAGYYNFFGATHPGGFKGADVFHYYMGSKYFEEIGYFELYHCTLPALTKDRRHDPADVPDVRDQRSLRLQAREATLDGVRKCPERFEPSRWREFKADAAFFRPRILGGSWTHLLVDHGYNPTPVWSFVGGLFSKNVAAHEKRPI